MISRRVQSHLQVYDYDQITNMRDPHAILYQDSKNAIPYKAVSCFPWRIESLNTLWHGEMTQDPDKVELWRKTISKWSGSFAAGGGRSLRVFITRPHISHEPLLRINIPDACSLYCYLVKDLTHAYRRNQTLRVSLGA